MFELLVVLVIFLFIVELILYNVIMFIFLVIKFLVCDNCLLVFY